MPLFRYQSVHSNGKLFFATIESNSLESAKKALQEECISFVSIKALKIKEALKLSRNEVLMLTDQLSQLLGANLSLFDSLELLKRQYKKNSLHLLIAQLSQKISSGLSFSQALAAYPQIFNALFITLIEAGEQSGQLAQALQLLHNRLKQKRELKQQIVQSLLYPAVLAIMSFGVIFLMIYYLVPTLESSFETQSFGPFSQKVFTACHHLKHYMLLYCTSFVMLLVSILSLKRQPKVQWWLDHFVLKIAFLKTLLITRDLVQYSASLQLLLWAKIPLLNAIKLCESLIRNQVLKKTLCHCRMRMAQGETLSDCLSCYAFFPPLMIQLIAVGESTAQLEQSFGKLNEIFSDQLERRIKKIMTFITPIALLLMALIIGVMMLAVLVPLTDINAFI